MMVRAMANLSKAKILVVDDEAHGRLALEHLLDGPDREVMVASSGEEAVRHVAKNEFALILLDVRMHGMDGFETAALIRERSGSERTPIIFLTGAYEDMASVIRGYAAGAVDYVVKPVQPEVLRSKVAVFVDLYYKNAELATQILERSKAERALKKSLTPDALLKAKVPAEGMNEDIHASREYRANLVNVMTRRAVAKL